MKTALLFLFILFFGLQNTAHAQITRTKSLKELKSDLAKIDEAIDVTRQKMNEIRDARFLPDLYFALAEFYVDKSRYMLTIKQLANKNTPTEELDFTAEKKPKLQAIEIYRQILEKFPDLKERDRAIFFIAHEYRELGQLEDMVRTYRELTSKFPQSKYWSESMLIVGNYFYDERKDCPAAMDMYNQILNRPSGPFTPLARYKMGYCYINLNKFKEALFAFEAVLKKDSKIDLSELPDIYRQTDIRREALLAIVWPYSEIEPTELAKYGINRVNPLEYFYALSPNLSSYRQVLFKLGQRLTLKSRYIAATRVFFEYLRLSNDLEERVEAIEKLYEAMKNSRKYWPVPGYTIEIANTVKQMRYTIDMPKKERDKNVKNFEIFARDAATRAQKRAKQTGAKDDYKQAILAYEAYLDAFPTARYAPVIQLNLAESYFNISSWVEAGIEYEKTAEARSNSKKEKSYLDSSLQAYISALKSPALLSRLQLTEARNGVRDIGGEFVKKYPRDKAVANLRFTIARTYYDERDFDKAVPAFEEYLKYHPRDSEAETAANLILDSFNQREDYDGLIAAGKRIASNSRLNSNIRKSVSDIVKQAEYKKLQSKAGDFSSPAYAKDLMKFAGKYKGTSLGDQALYEAFTTFKSKKDPRAYEAGEQLLAKHADSKYAKAVTSEMGKMALLTADYRRAASYFEIYAQKYPTDVEAKNLMKNAAQMRESMGDFEEGKKDYQFLGDSGSVARMDFMARNWSSLEKTANGASGIAAAYYAGLARYRKGDISSAKPYFAQAAKMSATNYEDQAMAAHSLYLLSSEVLKNYKTIQMQAGKEAQSIQVKNQQLGDLTKQLNNVIKYNNGKWTIAALYALGESNQEFAEFIRKAPNPGGLNDAQLKEYRAGLEAQAKNYDKTANSFYSQCSQTAEKFEVFTLFARGCLSRGETEVDEEKDSFHMTQANSRSPARAEEIRKSLYDKSRDANLLIQLSGVYTQSHDYSMAILILQRAFEVNKNNSYTISLQGVNAIYMNDLETAKAKFQEALKLNSADPVAIRGMAALYKQFRFQGRLKAIESKARRAQIPPKLIVHPWLKDI